MSQFDEATLDSTFNTYIQLVVLHLLQWHFPD